MILNDDILIAENARKILGLGGVNLSSINHKKLNFILRKGGVFSSNINKIDWNEFKNTGGYNEFLKNVGELYCLGYGSKFISLCLTLKYNIFISSTVIQKRIKNRNRLSYSINDTIFKDSDTILKGRAIYAKTAKSMYLSFKCVNIRNIARKKRIGTRVFYNTENNKIFLKRDDCSAKKITAHSEGELFISLYPLPSKLRDILKNTEKKYKSHLVELHLNSKDFGFNREDLISDNYARALYPELKKFGFMLPKERITTMSRSKGDLVVLKDNKKLIIELTDLGKESIKENYGKNHQLRDRLIGKIIRILALNEDEVVFVVNNKVRQFVINEDFRKIIEKYNINIIFTDFKKAWEIEVAKKIDNLFESK